MERHDDTSAILATLREGLSGVDQAVAREGFSESHGVKRREALRAEAQNKVREVGRQAEKSTLSIRLRGRELEIACVCGLVLVQALRDPIERFPKCRRTWKR